MENSNRSKNKPGINSDKEEKQKIEETLKEVKNNPVVEEALKKEKQPTVADDLSPIHNTREVGTSGGDQRATDAEVERNN